MSDPGGMIRHVEAERQCGESGLNGRSGDGGREAVLIATRPREFGHVGSSWVPLRSMRPRARHRLTLCEVERPARDEQRSVSTITTAPIQAPFSALRSTHGGRLRATLRGCLPLLHVGANFLSLPCSRGDNGRGELGDQVAQPPRRRGHVRRVK